ncbi:MAG: 30S ribosomal protein S7 [Bacteroidia bacterium]|nr:30S ribosomal protein S7 [Bacteroidia bacterium]MDW8134424.1 30S ribosomal protein S7 [Bacteroidia bacterium]
MRKGRPIPRAIPPDPKYKSELVARFVNKIMREGKKTLAYSIFYRAMDIVAQKTSQNPLDIFQAAVNNVMPHLEVRPRRVGGATLQIPIEPRSERKLSLSMRWIIEAARKRSERTMAERLAAELIAASRNEGAAVKKRDEVHRMAEANKAFAHFRF